MYKNNRLVIIDVNGIKIINPKLKNIDVNFFGENNYIEFKEPFRCKKMMIDIEGSDNTLKIDSGLNVNQCLKIYLGANTEIFVGENFSCGEASLLTRSSYGTKITIGNDCLLSYGVRIRTSDSHCIYSVEDKKLINEPKDITIGNHIWLCAGVIILKGSALADDCVVGISSVVNKRFSETNCILAGVNAKIVKRGINWNKTTPDKWHLLKEHLND